MLKSNLKSVLLVDDSIDVRKNLSKIIDSIGGYNIVGEAEDVGTAILLGNRFKPDFIILDINLTHGSGLDALVHYKKTNPNSKVIVFTNYGKDAFKKVSLSLGADYFLDKSKDIEQLIEILSLKSSSN